MFRAWRFIFLFTIIAFVLLGCSRQMPEEASNGIKAASDVFYSNTKEPTEEIDGVKLYKPAGFIISEKSNAQNIIMTRKNETYLLFVNPNEKENSKLFYELLATDKSKKLIAEETFTENGVFGFAAVVKSDNDKVELLASVGGTKMTTISNGKNIESVLAQMMEVLRSIQQDTPSAEDE
jgi:hypothetical protein